MRPLAANCCTRGVVHIALLPQEAWRRTLGKRLAEIHRQESARSFLRYVVGFAGRRDYYQVPVALERAGRLKQLCTDAYLPDFAVSFLPFMGRARNLISARHAPGLPSRRVSSLGVGELLGSRRRRAAGVAGTVATKPLSSIIGSAVATRVAGTEDGAFLYNFDWLAFRDAMGRRRAVCQVLFQAHPPASACQEILATERQRSGYTGNPDGDESTSLRDAARYDASLAEADLIVCASTFVKRLLIERGVGQHRLAVVPYGGDFQPRGQSAPHAAVRPSFTVAPLRLLWVGEMAFRKGYHVLFEALNLLPKGAAKLTMVCRPFPTPDLLAGLPANVTVVPSVPDHELERLFATHDVFVMPSLVEGFGLVYLEAMRAGLSVVGTPNSALPDLLQNGREGFIITPGNSVHLAHCIERYVIDRSLARTMGTAARETALPLTWLAFGAALLRTLDTLDIEESRT